MRTCIIKNNVPNPVSLVTRHPDYETIHCQLGHISDEAMRHISDNIEGIEKILSQTSFGHISINSSMILTVLRATESPQKDLSINTSHISRKSIMAEILSRSTGNHHVTVY